MTYDIRPGGGAASPVRVAMGATVAYEVTITVSDTDNEGLLFFLFDLLTDLGVDQSTGSIEFDPLIDQLFDLFQQFGTPSDDDILGIGATQGLVQGATPGVGQSGAQVLIRGELQTPSDQEGSFSIIIGPDTMTQLIAPGGDSIIGDAHITTSIGAGFTIQSLPDGDGDGDGVPDEDDNCPNVANAGQEDGDGDEFGDACDGCPGDAGKTAPGVCGCGVVDSLADADGDALPDCIDPTPNGDGTGEEELIPVDAMGCGAGVGLANLAGFWALCYAGLVGLRRRRYR